MNEWFAIKMRGIVGLENGDMEKSDILNRTIQWDSDRGIIYKADKKHAELITQERGLDSKYKGADVLGTKDTVDEFDDEELVGKDVKRIRAIGARGSFLAMALDDLQFSTKEVCRSMSAPKVGNRAKLKRLGRYLVKYPAPEWVFDGRSAYDKIVVFVDADWAGCMKTRRSTTGGTVTLGNTCLSLGVATNLQPSLIRESPNCMPPYEEPLKESA